jgi:DNA invertase Pin-like site-specific DNA recombinase
LYGVVYAERTTTPEEETMKQKRVALYARVSTDKQTATNQLRELQAVAERAGWKVVEEFVDRGVSGAKGREQRPALDKMLKAATRREFDLIAAWSVDRLGRSLQHLISLLGELHAQKIDLYLHQQGVDTTTPGGKALFQMMGVFAEFERAMIVERVRAGLQRARAQGKVLGRPKVGEAIEDRVRALRGQGKGIIKIAREVGIGVGTVQRVVNTRA